jgi:protein SCO1/2
VWVANFIFTSCAGPCPLLTARLSGLVQLHAGNARFRAVSVSVDPATDTPEVLKGYAERYRADPNTWHFLTGDAQSIQDLMVKGFKVGSGEKLMFHSNRFVLVDGELKIRGYYDGTLPEDMHRLKWDLKRLLREIS